ncbi:hypothetical protein [Variovorax sp. JS1663]|uniref:hypothetical protein n=1 Tax=Variovorax sp. JS1663 TaxID=1851577 RepID=UPI000B348633|nr:hypothetical protein [Variovorax sp. JS1663]OUM01036.1 hypothetical protein A8M77_18205 [Variovorax sp. JS1663]
MIALFGADNSGKAVLAEALSQRLEQRGVAATLVVAPLSERSPHALALEAYRNALILLVASASPTPVDDALRAALIGAKLGFAVVHGDGAEQLANAWNAIGAPADSDDRGSAPPEANATWSWACDKCSDPTCEHRLFTELLAQRR